MHGRLWPTRPPPASLDGPLRRLAGLARDGEPLHLLFDGPAADAKRNAAAAVAGYLGVPLLSAVLDGVEPGDRVG